ncbi:MAG: fatty acid desaturase, partial [Bacteroidia bacterium]
FWTSFLHELEHDLIHYLYFKKQPFLHNVMMAGVWIFRPMTVSPWFRRHLHLHHHKYSGLESDLEERAVTNGLKWGLFRALFLPDQILGVVLRGFKLYPEIRKMEKEGRFTKTEVRNFYNIVLFGFLPLGLPLYFAWYAYVFIYFLLGVQSLFSIQLHLPEICTQFLAVAQPFMVLLVIPNLFRQYCLHFITSNLHYYGDVEKGNFLQQTQILNAWWTLPFQLFCFNFGHTHAIHHFFVQETFYLRQLTANKALEVLRKNGVRFNDLGTFERANRYHEHA